VCQATGFLEHQCRSEAPRAGQETWPLLRTELRVGAWFPRPEALGYQAGQETWPLRGLLRTESRVGAWFPRPEALGYQGRVRKPGPYVGYSEPNQGCK
jgi:hypothetical protein